MEPQEGAGGRDGHGEAGWVSDVDGLGDSGGHTGDGGDVLLIGVRCGMCRSVMEGAALPATLLLESCSEVHSPPPAARPQSRSLENHVYPL